MPRTRRVPTDDGVRNTFGITIGGKRVFLSVRGERGEAALLPLSGRDSMKLAGQLLAAADRAMAEEERSRNIDALPVAAVRVR